MHCGSSHLTIHHFLTAVKALEAPTGKHGHDHVHEDHPSKAHNGIKVGEAVDEDVHAKSCQTETSHGKLHFCQQPVFFVAIAAFQGCRKGKIGHGADPQRLGIFTLNFVEDDLADMHLLFNPLSFCVGEANQEDVAACLA
jgi:hypothetical protein